MWTLECALNRIECRFGQVRIGLQCLQIHMVPHGPDNIYTDRPKLCEKAKESKQHLEIAEFKAFNGWVEKQSRAQP